MHKPFLVYLLSEAWGLGVLLLLQAVGFRRSCTGVSLVPSKLKPCDTMHMLTNLKQTLWTLAPPLHFPLHEYEHYAGWRVMPI